MESDGEMVMVVLAGCSHEGEGRVFFGEEDNIEYSF